MTEENQDLYNEEEGRAEEEEVVSFSLSSSTTQPPTDPRILNLRQYISVFHTFVPDIEVEQTQNNILHIKIPSSLLPITIRVAYGFEYSEILLNITLCLDDFNWRKPPIPCEITNPDIPDYCGKYLVSNACKKFFNNDYQPKPNYRSAALILRSQHESDIETVKSLEKVGYSHMQAVRAAALCHNNYDKCVTFLQTGQYDHEDSFEIIVDYRTCPLLYFILEVIDAILDLQDHCVMCGKETTLGLKPGVCNNHVCMYQFIDQGIGQSLVKEINRDPYVADLLFSVFSVASQTKFFEPKPQPPKFKTIQQIINNMPNMKKLGSFLDDRALCEVLGTDARDILRWVIFTCRSNFLLLPRELEFPQFRVGNNGGRCYQFMALTASPEQETCFQQMKAVYGSRFLWHGSGLERWHSIIRNGLKNMTGTQYMANGSAHGAGIYFAHDSNTSLGYARFGKNLYPKSMLAQDLLIIALCEVINLPLDVVTEFEVEVSGRNNRPEKKKLVGGLYNHGWCMTLTMNEASIVRFVFVNLGANVDMRTQPLQNIPTLNQVLRQRANLKVNE